MYIDSYEKEIHLKIVYYGPGLCGKTTNIKFLDKKIKPEAKGKLISLATETERTLFFDFLHLSLGTVNGFQTRFHLYTVPGQVFYDLTRRKVLERADGVVFVADSQEERREANIESYENLKVNLKENDLSLDTIPHVMQYNKRDLPSAMGIEQMRRDLNFYKVPEFEAIATDGQGVFDTLKAIAKLVLLELKKKH